MPEQDDHDKQPLLSEYESGKATPADPALSNPDVQIDMSGSGQGY